MKQTLRNIYLIGMTGVGKSTVGKILANKLQWAFVDVNETIEAIYGSSLKEIFANFGEDSFRNMEATMLHELSQGEHQVFACNSDSVVDEKKLQIMKKTGIIVWLDAPVENLLQRIEKMESPAFPEGDPQQTIESLVKEYKKYYQQADIRLPTDDSSPELAAEQILQILHQTI